MFIWQYRIILELSLTMNVNHDSDINCTFSLIVSQVIQLSFLSYMIIKRPETLHPVAGLGRVPDLRVRVQVRVLVICVSTSTSTSTLLLHEYESESKYRLMSTSTSTGL